MGTLMEINVAREFEFGEREGPADFYIADADVDCKFSQKLNGWEIGPHLFGYLCLVLWASDLTSQFQVGLVRAREEIMTPRANQDLKRRISATGSTNILWLWDAPMPIRENVLLHMDPAIRARIMEARGKRSNGHGQARLNELCRLVQGRVLDRTLITTVGHGLDDPMKRLRADGGARTYLQAEGILVLGHQDNDPLVAEALGLPIPVKGTVVAVRVVPAENEVLTSAEIAGDRWRIAMPDDPVVPAPIVGRKRGRG